MKSNLSKLAGYPVPIRLAVFILALLLVWIPMAVPIYWLVSDRNLVAILTMGILYGEFLILVQMWGQRVYRQSRVLQSYGLRKTRQNARELLFGLSLGLIFTLSLFGLEGRLGWLAWKHSPTFLPGVVLEGLASALALGFLEEILFRGWLLDELQRDYLPSVALWANSTLYALLHYIKSLQEILRTWPGFPGLLLLGLTLVWAKRSSGGRLGLSIGLHAGLVWGYYIINVGQLVQYSGQVPNWITGVDRNPLAGVTGLLFLGVLAFWARRRCFVNI